jgi:hypothetical protein
VPSPQVSVYVVDVDGETDKVPEAAPPVEKFVPVQEVAFEEDHVNATEFPFRMDVEVGERSAHGLGEMVALSKQVGVTDCEPLTT